MHVALYRLGLPDHNSLIKAAFCIELSEFPMNQYLIIIHFVLLLLALLFL